MHNWNATVDGHKLNKQAGKKNGRGVVCRGVV